MNVREQPLSYSFPFLLFVFINDVMASHVRPRVASTKVNKRRNNKFRSTVRIRSREKENYITSPPEHLHYTVDKMFLNTISETEQLEYG